MSWRERGRAGLAAAALVLGACGFEPLHGEGGGAPAELTQIRVDRIADRAGQELRNHLLTRLTPAGQPERPAYVLKVRLREELRQLGLRQDDVATRANLVLEAAWVLERAADGTRLTSGTLTSTNSYNILQSKFGTLSAEKNARKRAVQQISEALTTRLAAYLHRGAGA